MAHLATDPIPSSDTETRADASPLDWGAVIAGAALAAALSFVLLTFGTAIGLSVISPWPNAGLPATVIASLAAFWLLAQQIGSFLAGGYLAGRMRSRLAGLRFDESELRDGMHGVLVWALGVLLGAALALAAGSVLLRVGADIGSRAAGSVASAVEPAELALDAMLRPGRGAAGAPAGDARSELSRLLASSVASGPFSDQNRAYLAQRVSQLTGLSPQEAEARANEALTATRRAADQARRAAVLTGLLTATSLILSLAAAWRGAVKGGQHRDNAGPVRFGFDRYWRRPVRGA